jgi:hypothetical protein
LKLKIVLHWLDSFGFLDLKLIEFYPKISKLSEENAIIFLIAIVFIVYILFKLIYLLYKKLTQLLILISSGASKKIVFFIAKIIATIAIMAKDMIVHILSWLIRLIRKQSMKKSLGVIVIPENKRGLVFNKRGKSINGNNKVSISNEAGYQADLLAVGYHYNYWGWKYTITLIDPIIVKHNEIALIEAKGGQENNDHINLGKMVKCNNFQNARKFIEEGGERGRQLQILKEGEYFINSEMFTVITKSNSKKYGMLEKELNRYKVKDNMLGIITVLNGVEGKLNELSFVDKKIHNSYQNPQAFYHKGGKKGVQEEIITTGEYNINPWFVDIKQVPITEIPQGTVGVVVSNTGEKSENRIVDKGYIGVWKKPLSQGEYPINLGTKTVHLIPTMDITLEWSAREKKTSEKNYDSGLDAIKLLTYDGFEIMLEVSQTIKIKEMEAPTLISKISADESINVLAEKNIKYSAIRSLIDKVIKPSVGGHFTNIAHQYSALDFKDKKDEIQETAREEIQNTLNDYGVEAKKLSIQIIEFPEKLKKVLQDRAIVAEELANAEKENELILIREKNAAEIEKIRIQAKLEEIRELINIYGKDHYMVLQRLKEFSKIKLPDGGVYGDSGISRLIIEQFAGHDMTMNNTSNIDHKTYSALIDKITKTIARNPEMIKNIEKK